MLILDASQGQYQDLQKDNKQFIRRQAKKPASRGDGWSIDRETVKIEQKIVIVTYEVEVDVENKEDRK